MQSSSTLQRRSLGAFYTPEDVALLLARWVVRKRNETVFDPSFGDGSLLRAATRHQRTLPGRCAIGSNLYGVDIDRRCLSVLRDLSLPSKNLKTGDFLKIPPNKLQKFDVIIANPPYIGHHQIENSVRELVRTYLPQESGIPKTANMWVYFLLHSLNFLRDSGRLAMVLPHALVQAKYARPVLAALEKRFLHVSIILVQERLFELTRTPVAFLCCEGRGPGTTLQATVPKLSLLDGYLSVTQANRRTRGMRCAPNGSSVPGDVLESVENFEATIKGTIGDFATVRIGTVTGANEFFVGTRDDWKIRGVSLANLKPILTDSSILSSPKISSRKLDAHLSNSLLFYPKDLRSKGVRRWIRRGESEGIHLRTKCRRRTPWWRVRLALPSRAVIRFYGQSTPEAFMLPRSCLCTNSFFQIYTSPNVISSVVMWMHTSMASLWFETRARTRGGGALKANVGDVKNLPFGGQIIATGAFSEWCRVYRKHGRQKAMKHADRILTRKWPAAQLREIRKHTEILEMQRQPSHHG